MGSAIGAVEAGQLHAGRRRSHRCATKLAALANTAVAGLSR